MTFNQIFEMIKKYIAEEIKVEHKFQNKITRIRKDKQFWIDKLNEKSK